MKLDEVKTVEEITYTPAPPGELESRRLESVDAENIISVSHEERKRYIITEVNDPRDENCKLSLHQATHDGVIDYSSGQYLNPETGQGQC